MTMTPSISPILPYVLTPPPPPVRFDEKRHAEPERRKGKGVRRAFKPVTVGAGEETQGHLKILNSVSDRLCRGPWPTDNVNLR